MDAVVALGRQVRVNVLPKEVGGGGRGLNFAHGRIPFEVNKTKQQGRFGCGTGLHEHRQSNWPDKPRSTTPKAGGV